ncbi:MAG: bifunctional diaminohydroxyphosphoribosylaminopyrimidine deaminase/5-amino-6-(5-phosphoribosylamino)uracil reductase RibD [Ignavibacteriales bacterium]|nr:bifunctional diaminohydroxyphosphoribosylaminopyrimidine deaminase/5-amino-6-(5-phosphoribosylamino)uracil reductase RibD [Ignavibacteriales bacterium]
MTAGDTNFMMRCLELAQRGSRWVAPNPMVGCVIVRNGEVVGEGYHPAFGRPHAEIIALSQAGKRAKGGTLYVNLEPCVHTGKTPPCTKAIIGAGISQVIAATTDPNPLVSGGGFRDLRRAGIEVRSGLLRSQARLLNEKFFGFMEEGRPFVGVKIAQTLDGRIADLRGRSQWISSPISRTYGHDLRTQYHAVLVGAETVRRDNPELTVRHVRGRQPIRVVLDGKLSVPVTRKIFHSREAATILLTSAATLRRQERKVILLERRGVQVLGIEGPSMISGKVITRVLAGLGITSILVEGGSETVGTFFEEKLVDRVHCIVAPSILGSGTTGFAFSHRTLATVVGLRNPWMGRIGNDLLIEGKPDFS